MELYYFTAFANKTSRIGRMRPPAQARQLLLLRSWRGHVRAWGQMTRAHDVT